MSFISLLRSGRKNPFILSSATAVIGFNLANFVHFLANFFLVKSLSLEFYGEYTSAIAYAALIGFPLTVIMLMLIKLIGAKNPSQRQLYLFSLERRLFHQLKRHALLFVLALITIFLLLYRFANFSSIFSICFIFFSLAFSILITLYSAYLQGSRQFTKYYLASIFSALIKLIGYAMIFYFHLGLTITYLFLLASTATSLLLQRHYVYHHFHPPSSLPLPPFHLRQFLKKREVWLPAFTMAGILSFVNTDLILVKKLLPEIQAGLYSVLSLFAKMVGYFLQPIADVAFSFGAAKETKKHQHQNLLLTTLIFLFAGAAATVIYYFFAPQLIIIFAKKDYLAIGSLLPLAAIFGTLYMLNTLYSKHFLNQNHLIASLAFIFCFAQALSIFIFHTSFTQILIINIAASALLFLAYLIFYLKTKPPPS